MKVKLVADSSGNLLELEGADFVSVPLSIQLDQKTYVDDENLDPIVLTQEMLAYKGKSSTACPSVEAWLNAFEGGEEIYVVTITSALSGTYNSAMLAKQMYLEEHENAKICVIDTLSTGPEMHLILEKIIEWKQQGKTFEEICEDIPEYQKHTRLFFSLESVHNLVQNGRLSKLVGLALGKLGIRLVGTASEKGELEVLSKCRGDKKTLASYMEHLNKAGYFGGKLYISHNCNEELALQLKQNVMMQFPNANIRIYQTRGLCSYYAENKGMIVGVECK